MSERWGSDTLDLVEDWTEHTLRLQLTHRCTKLYHLLEYCTTAYGNSNTHMYTNPAEHRTTAYYMGLHVRFKLHCFIREHYLDQIRWIFGKLCCAFFRRPENLQRNLFGLAGPPPFSPKKITEKTICKNFDKFLSDPGVSGVWYMGPVLSNTDNFCRLNWCDSGWWRYKLNTNW